MLKYIWDASGYDLAASRLGLPGGGVRSRCKWAAKGRFLWLFVSFFCQTLLSTVRFVLRSFCFVLWPFLDSVNSNKCTPESAVCCRSVESLWRKLADVFPLSCSVLLLGNYVWKPEKLDTSWNLPVYLVNSCLSACMRGWLLDLTFSFLFVPNRANGKNETSSGILPYSLSWR